MSETPDAVLLDLDAARRERGRPDGIPVRFGGHPFTLPAELPLDVFDPFLSEDFDVVNLLRPFLSEEGDDDSVADLVMKVLEKHPSVIREALAAFRAALRLLFGAEAYAQFEQQRPGLGDYATLIGGLFRLYGVGLGEAFASRDSSENGGATPKQTSSSTTESTPETPGAAPAVTPAPAQETEPVTGS